MYLQQIQNICFAQELEQNKKLFYSFVESEITQELLFLKPMKNLTKTLNYTITEGSGEKKYLTAIIYNDL